MNYLRLKVFLPLLVVMILAFLPKWSAVLSGDWKNVYFPLAKYFSVNGNLANYSGSLMYPPGANLFFLSLPSLSPEIYQLALIGANLFFLILLMRLTRQSDRLTLVTLSAGPIIFFRFDLLVMLLVIISILSFKQGRYLVSGAFLGWGTVTKLFPVIFLPYFLFLLLSQRKYRDVGLFFSTFILSFLSIFFFYVLSTRQNWLAVISSMNGAFSVSVNFESVIGTLLTIVTSFTNPGPHGVEFQNALWVLSPLYFLGHDRVFRFIAPIFLAITYLSIVLKYQVTKTFRISTCLLLVLMLLISSQLLSPQYMIWPAMLFLLLPPKGLEGPFWKINFFLMILILVCTQIIYPLNYGELLDFYDRGINQWLFGVLVLRNLALVVLTARLFKNEIVQILPKKSAPSAF